MKEILRFCDSAFYAIPYIWLVMSIVYMVTDTKFNAFSMFSVVICWLVDRHNRSAKKAASHVAQSN